MKPKIFAKESDLCAAFIEAAGKEWQSYAETGGWDILLVRKSDGFQIGIEAKLRFNIDVLNQALEDGFHWTVAGPNPDCRAVLVPDYVASPLDRICAYVGITIIRMRGPPPPHVRRSQFTPSLPEQHQSWSDENWFDMATAERHPLPEYIPDVRAGASSPLQLTTWKVKAIKIAILLEQNGFVTRKDFAHFQIDHRRWIASGWLRVDAGRYVADCPPDFRHQHPVVYEQVKADIAKWAPKEPKLDLVQTGLPL